MKSRSLEHIAGNAFRDSDGGKVIGKLVTKVPVMLSQHVSSLWGRGYLRSSCMKSFIDEHWKEYSERYGCADGYVISSNVGVGDNTLFCAVNFYKIKRR